MSCQRLSVHQTQRYRGKSKAVPMVLIDTDGFIQRDNQTIRSSARRHVGGSSWVYMRFYSIVLFWPNSTVHRPIQRDCAKSTITRSRTTLNLAGQMAGCPSRQKAVHRAAGHGDPPFNLAILRCVSLPISLSISCSTLNSFFSTNILSHWSPLLCQAKSRSED